ncbi:hypothetical protein D5S18_03085 [Nocardia panacis]|uniref:Uncharacterized protein n=1 Tax=Nocardia panacis TaxID=2340916 RepID=A0A3A4KVR5_9NOCA|nr:hypothetical protein [Nocardia panacis]RJO79330.1 hypothetical protein D5S18_03085 [Nocardia panacis]
MDDTQINPVVVKLIDILNDVTALHNSLWAEIQAARRSVIVLHLPQLSDTQDHTPTVEPEPAPEAEPHIGKRMFVTGADEPEDVRWVSTEDGDLYVRREAGDWRYYVTDDQGERWGILPHTWYSLLNEYQNLWEHEPAEPEETADRPLSLSDTAGILRQYGFRTGQRRLKAHLAAIGWTDEFNTPTEQGTSFLMEVEPANSETMRSAVVRVTPAGISRLIELHKRGVR